MDLSAHDLCGERVYSVSHESDNTKRGEPDDEFPPVPEWKPDIEVPLDQIIDRFRYYANDGKDFVVLKYGTCVIVSDGLSDDQAKREALETVAKIFGFHLDFNPRVMDDGNALIFYNHPAYTIVLEEITAKHMDLIRANHQRALAREEVLLGPAGPNVFDEFGMKALFGRCYFFMDAKNPEVVAVIRKSNSVSG
jgi:hypothetical protein